MLPHERCCNICNIYYFACLTTSMIVHVVKIKMGTTVETSTHAYKYQVAYIEGCLLSALCLKPKRKILVTLHWSPIIKMKPLLLHLCTKANYMYGHDLKAAMTVPRDNIRFLRYDSNMAVIAYQAWHESLNMLKCLPTIFCLPSQNAAVQLAMGLRALGPFRPHQFDS